MPLYRFPAEMLRIFMLLLRFRGTGLRAHEAYCSSTLLGTGEGIVARRLALVYYLRYVG